MSTLRRGRARVATGTLDLSAIKVKQSAKICELRGALVAEGFRTLDEQAQALGLCRSTAWTILKGQHKASGLSATIINRILATPHLPQRVRRKILEYVAEKAAGLYGHSQTQQRRFVARLEIADGEDANALAADGVRGRLAIADRRRWKGDVGRSGWSAMGAANGNAKSRSRELTESHASAPSVTNGSRLLASGRSHNFAKR